MAQGLINIKADFNQVTRFYGALVRNMDRVETNTLNTTAFDVRAKDWTGIAKRGIDRPKPFTSRKSAIRVGKARRGKPYATVFLAPITEKYLLRIIKGASLKDKTVPANIRLNKYGNIASLRGGRKIQALLNKPKHFRSTINGLDAIWKRTARGIKPVLIFNTNARVRAQFDYQRPMVKAARKRIKPIAQMELKREINRAKRR